MTTRFCYIQNCSVPFRAHTPKHPEQHTYFPRFSFIIPCLSSGPDTRRAFVVLLVLALNQLCHWTEFILLLNSEWSCNPVNLPYIKIEISIMTESVQTFGRKVGCCFVQLAAKIGANLTLAEFFWRSRFVFLWCNRKPPLLWPSSRRVLVWSRSTVLLWAFFNLISSSWRSTSPSTFWVRTSSPT